MTRLSVLVLVLLSACSGPGAHCPSADAAPPATTAAFALVTSDYTSSAIALLDADGALLTEAYLDSGSASPGLAAALSGDVSLPTEAPGAGRLYWLDRLGVDLVGEADLATGALSQYATTPTAVPGEAAFRANPHDVLALPDGRWLVSRYEPNYASDASELDRGNDLVLLDPASHALLGRVGLEALDEDVVGPDGTVPTYARPDRMVLRAGRVVVGLARLSVDFKIAAPGAVAVVDADTGELQTTLLSGLEGCGELAPARDDGTRVFVACAGPTYTDLRGRRDGAGVASLHIPTSGPAEGEWIWRAAEHPELPPPTEALVPLHDDVVFVVSMGDSTAGERDRLLRLELGDGTGAIVYESPEAFDLGPGAVSPGGDFLLLPDAVSGVLRFDIVGDTLATPSTIDASPCRRLPARELRALVL